MVKKDGSLLDVFLRTSPLDGDSCLVTAADITAQKQAESMLRLTQFSVDHALDVIVWTNRKGEITYVNNAACTSAGRTRDELLSMKIFDIDPEMSEEKWGKGSGYAETRGRSPGRRHDPKERR